MSNLTKAGGLLSIEALIMLPVAILLDIIGLICTILIAVCGVGAALSYVPDILGLLFLGSWMFFRGQFRDAIKRGDQAEEKKEALTQKVAQKGIERKKMMKKMKKTSKIAKVGRNGRFLISLAGEMVPILGCLPFWTICVFMELKNDD